MIISYIVGIVLSYLLGSIPFGYLIAITKGIDIRIEGSGNIGATNVSRGAWKKVWLNNIFPGYVKGIRGCFLCTPAF